MSASSVSSCCRSNPTLRACIPTLWWPASGNVRRRHNSHSDALAATVSDRSRRTGCFTLRRSSVWQLLLYNACGQCAGSAVDSLCAAIRISATSVCLRDMQLPSRPRSTTSSFQSSPLQLQSAAALRTASSVPVLADPTQQSGRCRSRRAGRRWIQQCSHTQCDWCLQLTAHRRGLRSSTQQRSLACCAGWRTRVHFSPRCRPRRAGLTLPIP